MLDPQTTQPHIASVFPHEAHETVLQIKGVSLTLGGNQILKNVDGEIKNIVRPGFTQGQVIALLGPSGIGKTQLLRILAGLQPSTAGTVTLNGNQEPVTQGSVGVVAQHYPLFEHRTVLGNLLVAGRQAGLKGEDGKGKAFSLLERFGLTERANFYPSQLSGGQRQRVAIAQQLMCSDHFIILDEPFSGLDPIMVEKVCKLITELASADELNTIIVITHDIPAAVAVSDTIWLMGRDHDTEGNIIPGSRIQKQYDLMDLGLAWHENIVLMPEFSDLVREIRSQFKTL